MFANILLHFLLSLLVFSSTIHPNLLCMVQFTYIRYCSLLSLLPTKTVFVQLQVCIAQG